MKAIELTEPGGPEVMHLREIPTPIPQESEVLIRVAVTGVNFIDLNVREGRYGNELPFTPGQEAAGTVVAVGKSVSHLQEGDRVAWCSFGSDEARVSWFVVRHTPDFEGLHAHAG
ncbi:MAG: alcohol dehydrogenase catalytic domain-containing protein [Chthoniobacterales bacterium]|jgi:NADPH2:quinone reductase